jgi:hypothetical protein
MLAFLKSHPFAVEAFFERSLVFTYALPKEDVRPLIPECLSPDTLGDRWGFIAVAMVQTRALRPKGLPRFMGQDFFLVGYRVFVRFTSREGKTRRGLYVLWSETDKRKMALFGNIFTHYKYSTTDIRQRRQNGVSEIYSDRSGFKIEVECCSGGNIPLPDGSPFQDWKDARQFSGPLPFTFAYRPVDKTVLVIEGVRENWKPLPVKVRIHEFSFFKEMHLKSVQLANAFIVENVPYWWKKGRVEKWQY